MLVNPLQAFFDRSGVAILDGGLATELERRGASLDDPLWSAKLLIEDPNLIRQVHLDYLRAGADIVTTASYQASLPGFRECGLDARESANLLRLSVDLAKQARRLWESPSRITPLIAASIGCYGAFLHDGSEYRGDYGLTKRQLMDFHRPRLEILAQCQPDLLACETIPCQVEAEALVELLEEVRDVPAWISFSCRDEMHTSHGERLGDCLSMAEASPQVVAVGINCTAPRFVNGLLDAVAGQARKPLVVYPNRGETWDAQSHCWNAGQNTPTDWGQAARGWHAAGVRIIGGCCRTTPDDIREMAVALKQRN